MAVTINIAEVAKPIEEALNAAIKRVYEEGHGAGRAAGYADGYAAAVADIMSAAQSMAAPSAASARPTEAEMPKGVELEAGKPESEPETPKAVRSLAEQPTPTPRAPKGILDSALDLALEAQPGMTTPEVEVAVLEIDGRIGVRSVYNRLRHFENIGRKFRRRDGRWYRIEDLPPPWAEPSSPQGETGGVTPPGLFEAAK
ncbi:hypothetical protein [Sphingomonas sp. ERG5]|uniref:hypothetical protein n=1 Tax=Sphingomonas sp. ERG5 TaxID=1381597 RepID=UPI00054B7212|nr:hypothetical protein [Sphingomonas sp. ERG5]